MLVAEYIVFELSGECAPFPILTVVSESERALVAIPSVAQPGQTRHLAFHPDLVGRWNEQEPKGHSRSTPSARDERRAESTESRSRSSRKIAEKRSDAGPLTADAAAARGHAGLGRVVEF